MGNGVTGATDPTGLDEKEKHPHQVYIDVIVYDPPNTFRSNYVSFHMNCVLIGVNRLENTRVRLNVLRTPEPTFVNQREVHDMPDPKVIQHFKDHTRLEWLVDWKDNLPAESKKDTDQGLSEEELTPLANPEPNNKAYMKMTPAELKSTREALYP